MKAIYAATITLLSGILFFLCGTLISRADDAAVLKLRKTSVRIAIGSGSIVEGQSGKHYLLTNWHVCNSGKWLGKMRANYEGGELLEGEVVKESPIFDLCATKLNKSHEALKVGKELKVGDQIYTRGYPYGVLSETTGQYLGKEAWDYIFVIEEVGTCFKGSKPIQDAQGRVFGCQATYIDNMTNMYSRPGSSGSPVVNSKGEMVGVISSWIGGQDLGGMVPLEYIQEFMKGL